MQVMHNFCISISILLFFYPYIAVSIHVFDGVTLFSPNDTPNKAMDRELPPLFERPFVEIIGSLSYSQTT